MKTTDFKEKQLNRNELKNIYGGRVDLVKTYKCCWAYTDNCSACRPMGSCVSGAVLTNC